MNTTTLKVGLMICVTLFTGWIVTRVHAANVTTTDKVKSAWQYGTFDYPPEASTLDSELNGLAKAGWEIISVSKYVDPSFGLRACVAVRIPIVPGTNSYKSGN